MMERYSEYKDSGVKWLGEIPSHWELRKIFGLFSENKRKNTAFLYKHAMQFNYGTIVDKNECFDTEETKEIYSNYSLINKGDIVINGLNLNYDFVSQRVAISPKNGIITSAYVVISPKVEINTYFYCYLFKNMDNMKIFHGMGTGVRKTLSYKELRNHDVLLPPLSEQDAIVRYLDTATSEIDKAIAMQQKMIDLLNERKQIIIQNAVTKGLDENVEMKESGCKILGKIPTTWNVCKTLYILSMPITDGPHTTPQFYSDGIPFVSAEAVSCGNGYIDFTHIRGYISDTFYDECCKKYIPQINDIYMIKSGATTGKVAIVDTNTKFTIWSPLAVFRANRNKVLPDFLYYSLQSQYYQLQVQDKWSFGTQQNIGMRTLEKLIVCYPSIDEQSKIIEYIKNKVLKLDTAITNCQRQITLLQERKQIIINEVVTGKVRVS